MVVLEILLYVVLILVGASFAVLSYDTKSSKQRLKYGLLSFAMLIITVLVAAILFYDPIMMAGAWSRRYVAVLVGCSTLLVYGLLITITSKESKRKKKIYAFCSVAAIFAITLLYSYLDNLPPKEWVSLMWYIAIFVGGMVAFGIFILGPIIITISKFIVDIRRNKRPKNNNGESRNL